MTNPPPTSTQRSIVSGLRNSLQQLLAFASLIAIVTFFSIVSPHFFTPNNIVSVLTAATVTGMMAPTALRASARVGEEEQPS